jgi:hypothetical protein
MADQTSCVRSRVLLAIVSLALLAPVACASPQPLVNPAPIAAASTPHQTRVAILRALADKGYTLESERAGDVVARYSERNWHMVIEIAYSNEVTIRYVSSENLDYGKSDKGVPVIHRGYNTRVQQLAKEIGTEVTIARIADTPPPVGSPPPSLPQPE